MKLIKNLQQTFQGLLHAGSRYPLTVLFLAAVLVVNAISIQQEQENYTRYLFTFLIGALLSGVAQHVYERFSKKQSDRFLLMGGAILLSIGYYFIIRTTAEYSLEISIKTGVAAFALIFAFIWVPTIKKKLSFNESFMSAFKAFFITILFTVIIAIGVSSILFAIDRLLFSVDYKATLHLLNVVFSLFAPLYFLSFTPPYVDMEKNDIAKEDTLAKQEQVRQAVSCPRNLEILLSYVVIPLTVIYTAILLAYIVLNIGSSFWTDNLLEPLLVSYAVTVILVYILASTIENKFAVVFRKIFPKVLIPIVLFQTIASILKIREMGITQGRYYVILFGVFATIAGLVFSFLPVRKNGLVAAVLIVFCLISIIPPIDAFTVSRVNQTHLLEDVLVKNKMLENNEVIPNPSISEKDKVRVTETFDYLERMDYVKDVEWLPSDAATYQQFETTFGFAKEYENQNSFQSGQYVSLDWDNGLNLSVEGYDQLIRLNLYGSQAGSSEEGVISFEKDGSAYTLMQQLKDDGYYSLSLTDEEDKELIRIDMKEIFDEILTDENVQKGTLTMDEATIVKENKRAKVKILVESMDAYEDQYNGSFYLFVEIK
ncbi:DUF4153 domain-containing protein [Carnobacterium sp. CS13]|uniref:DUF4153 domain-containing protein n=1 Tax=unclassified Carnobacterium TaxID=257487 RepID=UPI0019123D00|nr:DUF4153 domain-containing protein [Carnobacterium sp. CS13]QQP70774.1 DUF4153 domain-containing protein [Carnobacterium sp. CS13]